MTIFAILGILWAAVIAALWYANENAGPGSRL